MKFCFSTLGCTERSLDDVLTLAKKYSIDALELRGLDGVMDNRKIAALSPESREETLSLQEHLMVTCIPSVECT